MRNRSCRSGMPVVSFAEDNPHYRKYVRDCARIGVRPASAFEWDRVTKGISPLRIVR